MSTTFLKQIESEIETVKRLEREVNTPEVKKLYAERINKLIQIRVDYMVQVYISKYPNINKDDICRHTNSWRELSSKQLTNGNYKIDYKCIRCNLTSSRIIKKKEVIELIQ